MRVRCCGRCGETGHYEKTCGRERSNAVTRYWERKLAGICIIDGCRSPAKDTAVMCAQHAEQTYQRQRERHTRDDVRARHAEYYRRWRAARAAAGECRQCRAPVAPPSKTMCERHKRMCKESQARRAEKANGGGDELPSV